jgi:CRISPR-associated protein Cas1
MAIVQHLILDEHGTHLGKHSGRLCVTRIGSGERLFEAPLLHLESVLIATRGVSLSADAVAECAERGIPIYFLSPLGNPLAALYSAGLTGTIQTRRAQLSALLDQRGLHLACAFALGKIRNQANLLRYGAKYRKKTDEDAFHELQRLIADVLEHEVEVEGLLEGEKLTDQVRFRLLSAEGRAAQRYWDGFQELLISKAEWPGRKTRGASDPVNSALNYGYGILYGAVERACVLAGLDPYGGFLHVDRPGKPSLVLDLIEEFRQTVVDRTVLGFFNKGQKLNLDAQGRIDVESRRALARKVLRRMDARERYGSEKLTMKAILQRQARAVAAYLRGERETYSPYLASW